MDYPISPAHPAADAFPWLEEDKLQELADDIAANGQEEEIIQLPDGRIVDGRNREFACLVAGVKPRYRTVELSEEEVIQLVKSRNLHRRHMGESQLAMAAAVLANLKPGRPSEKGTQVHITREEVAKDFGISKKSIQRAARVRKEAPELVKPIQEGKLDVTTAAEKLLDLPRSERKKIAAADDPKKAAEEAIKSRPDPRAGAAAQKPERPPVPEEEFRDAKGRVVPDSLMAEFVQGQAMLKEVRRLHREILELLKDATEETWGVALQPRLSHLEQNYRQAGNDVYASIPFVCCPHVNDEGEHSYGGVCKVCVGGRGWLTRDNFHQLPDNLKKLIEGPGGAKPVAASAGGAWQEYVSHDGEPTAGRKAG